MKPKSADETNNPTPRSTPNSRKGAAKRVIHPRLNVSVEEYLFADSRPEDKPGHRERHLRNRAAGKPCEQRRREGDGREEHKAETHRKAPCHPAQPPFHSHDQKNAGETRQSIVNSIPEFRRRTPPARFRMPKRNSTPAPAITSNPQ